MSSESFRSELVEPAISGKLRKLVDYLNEDFGTFLSFILHDEITGVGFKRLVGICGILSGIRKDRRKSFQLFI